MEEREGERRGKTLTRLGLVPPCFATELTWDGMRRTLLHGPGVDLFVEFGSLEPSNQSLGTCYGEGHSWRLYRDTGIPVEYTSTTL